MKRKKIATLFIFIGIGIPLVLFFFQSDGMFQVHKTKTVQRELTSEEISTLKSLLEKDKMFKKVMSSEELEEYAKVVQKKFNFLESLSDTKNIKEAWRVVYVKKLIQIPFRSLIGIGILLVLIGFGLLIFSFFPQRKGVTDERKK